MAEKLFMSPAELEELTGYRRAAEQSKWLRERRYVFETSARGRPMVLRAHVLTRLGGVHSQSSAPEPKLRLA